MDPFLHHNVYKLFREKLKKIFVTGRGKEILDLTPKSMINKEEKNQ